MSKLLLLKVLPLPPQKTVELKDVRSCLKTLRCNPRGTPETSGARVSIITGSAISTFGWLAMGRRTNFLLGPSLHSPENPLLNEPNEFFFRLIWTACQSMIRKRFVVNGSRLLKKVKPFTLNHFYLLPGRDRLQLRVQGSPVQRTGTQCYLGFVQVIESEETKSAH